MGIVDGDGLKESKKKRTEKYFVDYDKAYANNFRTDVQKATKYYLDLDNLLIEAGSDENGNYSYPNGFVLYPQALNPFLKVMETLGESRNIIILPAFNCDDLHNLPAYMIIKINGELCAISEILTEKA
jgi:hypothetical protein